MEKYIQDNKIIDYLLNRMDESERSEFSIRIDNDPELAEEVKFFKTLGLVARKADQEKFKDAVSGVHQTLGKEGFFLTSEKKLLPDSSKTRIRKIWRPIAIAASILLVIGVSGKIWVDSQFSSRALANQYFEPVTSISEVRIGENQPTGQLDRAKSAFDSENFELARQEFSTIASDSPLYTESQYFLGHTYDKLANYDQAIESFRTVISAEDVRFQDQAEWYLVQMLLKTGRSVNEVMESLDKIAEDGTHSFQKDAQELQEKLNSFWRQLAS